MLIVFLHYLIFSHYFLLETHVVYFQIVRIFDEKEYAEVNQVMIHEKRILGKVMNFQVFFLNYNSP